MFVQLQEACGKQSNTDYRIFATENDNKILIFTLASRNGTDCSICAPLLMHLGEKDGLIGAGNMRRHQMPSTVCAAEQSFKLCELRPTFLLSCHCNAIPNCNSSAIIGTRRLNTTCTAGCGNHRMRSSVYWLGIETARGITRGRGIPC